MKETGAPIPKKQNLIELGVVEFHVDTGTWFNRRGMGPRCCGGLRVVFGRDIKVFWFPCANSVPRPEDTLSN